MNININKIDAVIIQDRDGKLIERIMPGSVSLEKTQLHGTLLIFKQK